MFTALWIVNTIPVKIAAVSATPSDCTPIDSISWRINRKYLGGSARLRMTRPVRRPSPPYQTTVRLRERRSEERRVGEECRSRGGPYHLKKKKKKEDIGKRVRKREMLIRVQERSVENG